jgi:UDP-glucose 4-epimerase
MGIDDFQKGGKKMTPDEKAFRKKRVLVTGGLGFIGSNLSARLVESGARVTIVDNMIPRLGGNLFNVKEIVDDIHINFSDIRDAHSMDYLVKGQEVIFHLAGQVNHVDSIRNPIQDLDINCRGTLVLLESCQKYNREVKIIFAGTRGEYGSSVSLPVDEDHPTNPKGIYAVTNLTAEKMVFVYHDVHKIAGSCLRITNTYGHRHQMAHDEYGVLNWFIRKAIDDEVIPVFGDGRILRDFLYVDDLVDCFLQVATCEQAYGEVFNVGTGIPINFINLAKKIIEIAGSGKMALTEFTQERKEVEPGDYYTNISKIKRIVGWRPETSIEEGLRRTIEFYRKYRKEYWE